MSGIRWGRIIAAVLGGVLALWLLQGDTGASDELQEVFTVERHNTFDFAGTQFFQFRNERGGFVVSVQGSSPLAAELRRFDGKRAELTLKPYQLERIER